MLMCSIVIARVYHDFVADISLMSVTHMLMVKSLFMGKTLRVIMH